VARTLIVGLGLGALPLVLGVDLGALHDLDHHLDGIARSKFGHTPLRRDGLDLATLEIVDEGHGSHGPGPRSGMTPPRPPAQGREPRQAGSAEIAPAFSANSAGMSMGSCLPWAELGAAGTPPHHARWTPNRSRPHMLRGWKRPLSPPPDPGRRRQAACGQWSA